MAQDQFRVFLSAVTSECDKARDALGADLRSRDTLLRVQSDFRQEAGSDTTLKKLHDYIRDCSAVVCVIGKRSGALPPPPAAEPFNHILPPGITTASYTQWEFFFARHFRRRLSIYIANDDYQPDGVPTSKDDPALQQAFLAHIVDEQGLDRSYFSNGDQLRLAVLKEDWPKKPEHKPIALPYLSLGSLFRGRDAFLTDLHGSLNRSGGRTAVVGSVLYGLGGIGKTRAAVEYAWAHREDYSALLFVIAETPEGLRRNLAALAGPLVLNLPEQSAIEEPVRLKAVLDWLSEHPGFFLILDNVDTKEALAEAERLLSTLSGGHIIITSRLANFAGHFDPLELDVLGLEHAAAFLLERTDRRRQRTPDDATVARQLAIDLGQLALALEQAAAYIAKRGLSFARYRQLWQENWARVAGWADPAITKYPRAVALTWQTSVNQLSEPGRRLLDRLAWLAPEPLPNFLIEVPAPGFAAEDTEEALADLAGYSLVRRNPQSQEFSVHRLVQDVTRRSLVEQQHRPSLIEALGWINAGFPSEADNVRNWPRADALAPHAQAVIEHANAAGIALPTATLMNHLGVLLWAKALYAGAEPFIRRALAINKKSYGPDHPNVAMDLSILALLLRDTNRLSEGEPLIRRALAIDEKSYGPNHPTVAIRLNNLALLLRATNQLSEAESLYWRALAIDEKSYGPDNPNVAIRLNNLAFLLAETNRLSEAERLYRRALAINKKSYGPDHPNVARSLNNLALLLLTTNRLSEAEPLYRRALAIAENSYGPDHPNVATCLSNLADLLLATNRLSEAEPLIRRALAIDEKGHGPNHPTVAIRLSNLANWLRATNRLSEAEPLIRRALAINKKSYGPDHPNVAKSLNNLALLLRATNRLSEAERLIRRALAISEKSYGPDHPQVATWLNNLSELLRATNRLSEAEPLIRRALAIDEKSYGPHHPDVARDLNNLAELLRATDSLCEAEPLYRRALAIDEKSYGPHHPNVATRLNNLAGLLRATNRLSEAEPLIRRALAIFQKSYGPDQRAMDSGAARNPQDPTTSGKVRRNEPCPCGSGKRYKHCHGSLV